MKKSELQQIIKEEKPVVIVKKESPKPVVNKENMPKSEQKEEKKEEKMVEQVEKTGQFDLSGTPEFAKIREQYGFVSGSSTHNQRVQSIREVYREYKQIIDPHTADGVFVAYQHLEKGVPMIVLETAQAAKFEDTIQEALNLTPPRPDSTHDIESLPQRVFNLPNQVDAIKEFISKHV